MDKTKAQVTADLIAGSRNTSSRFVTVLREDAVLALGSVPAAVLEFESHPASGMIIVRREAWLAALETEQQRGNNGEADADV